MISQTSQDLSATLFNWRCFVTIGNMMPPRDPDEDELDEDDDEDEDEDERESPVVREPDEE